MLTCTHLITVAVVEALEGLFMTKTGGAGLAGVITVLICDKGWWTVVLGQMARLGLVGGHWSK